MSKIRKAYSYRLKTNRDIEEKLSWRGGILVEVNSRHTSQTCSCCGHTAKENRVSQDVFRCQVCGHEEKQISTGA